MILLVSNKELRMTDQKTCTVRFDGYGYKLGFGVCSSTDHWKTFANACRAAQRKGYVNETTVDPKIEYMANENKTKIVTNLISGKLVRIPVNTPIYCDPSSESYHSM
jgi:hypothetical protein